MTQNEGFILRIATTAYNMKKCSGFSTVIFVISPNLAKHTYGCLPLQQHHKTGKKKRKRKKATDL
jgi:hypothetical protein